MTAILYLQSERFKLLFDQRVTPMLPTKFRVNWPFGSREKIGVQDSAMAAILDF